jgi:hypothetical protein
MTLPISNPLSREQVYRIVIHSKDAISGTFFNGVHYVNIPDYIDASGEYHLAVEEFLLNNSSAQAGITRTLVVEAEISQPDTYSTSTRTNSQVLFTLARLQGGTSISYNKTITTETYGIPLVDNTFLSSKQLRIILKRADDVVYDSTTNGMGGSTWEMTLAIYPFRP